VHKKLLWAAVIVGMVTGAAIARADDPIVGTWKLNVEKSKTSFKSGTSVIEAEGDGIKVTADLVGGDDTAYHWTFTAKFDGSDTPVTGNSPFGNTVALKRVNPRTVHITVKQDGKVTVTQTMAVSADGKSRTLTTKGKDLKGQPVSTMTFYDKQ
jgi:hypothetical protein